jgi:hypothetical protein
MNLDPCRIASEPYYEPLGNEIDVRLPIPNACP